MYRNVKYLCGPLAALLFLGCGDETVDPAESMDAGTQQQGDGGTAPGADGGVAPQPDAGAPVAQGIPILGSGRHSMDAVNFKIIADSTVGHQTPTDLAFHPQRPDELWVINQGDHSMWIAQKVGTPEETSDWYQNASGAHFMAKPSALSFGDDGIFATAHDEDEITQPSTPADFMGPTLWLSDLERRAPFFQTFDGGHASHLDMLHNSPQGKGIAWDSENTYWYFDGMHGSITRYAFNSDHGPGGADHSDGVVARFAEGEVKPHDTYPSHLAMDHAASKLYIADTGNNRIAILDTTSGQRGRAIFPNYDGTSQYEMSGADIQTFIDGPAAGLRAPVGIELHDGYVFVSDADSGRIYAFDKTDGKEIDYLETGLPPGSLMGFAFDAEGRITYVDAIGNRVLRISARPQ